MEIIINITSSHHFIDIKEKNRAVKNKWPPELYKNAEKQLYALLKCFYLFQI